MNAHAKIEFDINEIYFHYQSIMQITTSGNPVEFACEALCRGYEHERITTGKEVVESLSKKGMLGNLDLHTLNINLNALHENEDLTLSVNLSAYSLNNSRIISTLENHSNLSRRLIIEITETDRLMQVQLNLLRENIISIKSLGYRIAVDDFGDGYSSLRYIIKLPVDFIKISRLTLMDLMEVSAIGKIKLVKSLLSVLKRNHMQVVVEGIESEKEFQLAKYIGGDLFQGYLFDKPSKKY